MNARDNPAWPLVAVLGPTASGKSALAVTLAERLSGEVVTCDSTQLYRHFDVGTGKLRGAEQRGIRHHMVDLVEPNEVFTAGDYRRQAIEILEDIRNRAKLPILTVGTGLYFRALIEGLADAPARSDLLRARLHARGERYGAGYLHGILTRLDRRAAQRIARSDLPKVIRAIEVCLLAGKPISEVHAAGREALRGFAVMRIGLLPPRQELYRRIEQRVDEMLNSGWIEEVAHLVAYGLDGSEKPFQFIGYSEIRDHLAGHLKLEETRKAICQATRRYAKRQITWFRREADVKWFAGFGDDARVAGGVTEYLEEHGYDTCALRNAQTKGV